jgi:hypothetical protein
VAEAATLAGGEHPDRISANHAGCAGTAVEMWDWRRSRSLVLECAR